MIKLKRLGGRTITTAPDGLPYPGPDDYQDPADAPLALGALANAVQAALLKKQNIKGTTLGQVTLEPGWKQNTDHYGGLAVRKQGQVCIARGMVRRATTLEVEDNTVYRIGTLDSALHQPLESVRLSAIWTATVSTGWQSMNGQVVVFPDGTVNLVTHSPGTMHAEDLVSWGGTSWMGP